MPGGGGTRTSLVPLKKKADDYEESVPVPTREALRLNTRMLRERRTQRAGAGKHDPGDASVESVSAAIRQRTQLTIQQAHAQPDSANIFAAREQELQRQRTRLEELRRTYDLLHAEYVGKQDIRKTLELTLSADRRAPRADPAVMPPESPPLSPGDDVSPPPGSRPGSQPAPSRELSTRQSQLAAVRMTPLEEVTERVRVAQVPPCSYHHRLALI